MSSNNDGNEQELHVIIDGSSGANTVIGPKRHGKFEDFDKTESEREVRIEGSVRKEARLKMTIFELF